MVIVATGSLCSGKIRNPLTTEETQNLLEKAL